MRRLPGSESVGDDLCATQDAPVCDQVVALELSLLRPDVRASHEQLDRLLSDEFLEIGATGRMFGKDDVLGRLPHETGIGFSAEDMRAYRVAPEIVLVVYRAVRRVDGVAARSMRSSWWRCEAGRWRMLFHQGTSLPAAL